MATSVLPDIAQNWNTILACQKGLLDQVEEAFEIGYHQSCAEDPKDKKMAIVQVLRSAVCRMVAYEAMLIKLKHYPEVDLVFDLSSLIDPSRPKSHTLPSNPLRPLVDQGKIPDSWILINNGGSPEIAHDNQALIDSVHTLLNDSHDWLDKKRREYMENNKGCKK